MKTILESLAEFAVRLPGREIPPAVLHQAERCLLDFIGCYWGGFGNGKIRRLLDLASEVNPKPEATLWGTGRKAGMAEAAMAHGCIGHHLEYDDGISLGAHWGSETLPAILAMAECSGHGGRDVLPAIVVAYEVGNRVSQAFSKRLLNRGIHFPSAMGVFGAAAGVCRLAGWSVSETAGALGNACLTPVSPYLPALTGAPIKDAYAGWPNALGILAARLSRAGCYGPHDLLEGKDGIGRIVGWTGATRDLRRQILHGLGSTFEIRKTYFKPFPCCRWLHAPAQAVLEMKKEGEWRPEEVSSILVEGPEFLMSYDKRSGFDQEISARFSIPYAVAASALLNRLDIEAFGSKQRTSRRLEDLAKKVSLRTDGTFEKMFPESFQTRVRITTRKGKTWERVSGLPWGPGNPPTDSELEQKFTYLSRQSLETSRIERWLALFREGFAGDRSLKKTIGLLSPAVIPTRERKNSRPGR